MFVPAAQLSTTKARSVLPTQIRHGDAALNSARAALLVLALTSHPEHLLDATREWLHQEARRDSFAASMGLVDSLRAAGHAAVVSGAGPSVLVLVRGAEGAAVAGIAGDDWTVLDPGVPVVGAQVEDVTPATPAT